MKTAIQWTLILAASALIAWAIAFHLLPKDLPL
jgi:hypothetical protein